VTQLDDVAPPGDSWAAVLAENTRRLFRSAWPDPAGP